MLKIMSSGADANAADKYGVTPIMVALPRMKRQNVDYLIKNCNLSIEGTNSFSGQNVFHILASFGLYSYDYVFEKALASCPNLINQQ